MNLKLIYHFEGGLLKIDERGTLYDLGHYLDTSTIPGITVNGTGQCRVNGSVDITQARNVISNEIKHALTGHDIRIVMYTGVDTFHSTVLATSRSFTTTLHTTSIVTNDFDLPEHIVRIRFYGSRSQLDAYMSQLEAVPGVDELEVNNETKVIDLVMLELCSPSEINDKLQEAMDIAIEITGGTTAPAPTTFAAQDRTQSIFC